MIYGKFAQEYFDKGLIPVPLFPSKKNPMISDWQKPELYNDSFSEKFPNANIGLLLQDIIVVDIDTTDKSLQKEIYDQLPPVFVGKIGNKDKGINFFFKSSGEVSQTFKAVEILAVGKQTVLPPSIHPNGYEYIWINKSLLEIDLDHLPLLPSTFLPWCNQRFNKKEIKEVGRNNSLAAQATAAITKGTDLSNVINELIIYDKEHHSPPLFEDKKEANMKGGVYSNAARFVSSIFISLSKSKVIIPSPVTTHCRIELLPEKVLAEAPSYKKIKLLPLRGTAQLMFEHIYNASPIGRTRFAYASALSCMGLALSNRVRYQNIHTNTYTLIIAPSGSGKNYPMKFPMKLFYQAGMKDLVRMGRPASDSAILKGLELSPSRLDLIDEIGSLFSSIINAREAWQSAIQDTYAELFTASGEYFAGKVLATKSTPAGNCFSPCVSILGAMTIKDFKNSFNENIMAKGFGGRCLFFADDEQKFGTKPNVDDESSEEEEHKKKIIPVELIKEIKRYRPAEQSTQENPATQLQFFGSSRKYFLEVAHAIEKKKMLSTDDDKMKPLYNRTFEQFVKLMLIDTVSTNVGLSFDKVKITKDNIEWAFESITKITQNTECFLGDYLSGSQNEKTLNALELIVRSAGPKGLTLTTLGATSLGRSLGKRARDEAIHLLIEYGQIKPDVDRSGTKPVTTFYSTKFVKE